MLPEVGKFLLKFESLCLSKGFFSEGSTRSLGEFLASYEKNTKKYSDYD